MTNDLGLNGIEFVEYTSKDPVWIEKLFKDFGFTKRMTHKSQDIDVYKQNDIQFILNREAGSFADGFTELHGPAICSMGWRVRDAEHALKLALQRGARQAERVDYRFENGAAVPAIFGIGDSLIYFVEEGISGGFYKKVGFSEISHPENLENKGFTVIDHLTNNVPKGEMEKWSNFYKDVFGFTEVRYFDIRGEKTGLLSYALKSPCGKFCIPINEGTEDKSQINEYLREYRGAGIQHLAFLTEDILSTLDRLEGSSIETLDIDDEYYREVFERVPNVTEDRKRIRHHNVLVDGDDDGYLLQIFTKNIIGPIFIEIIQRKNHFSFGEGNFGALFRSIERDQEKRGVL